MSRKSLSRFVVAAVLALGLLLPAVAAARGPVRETVSRPGWGILPGSLWDLLLQALAPASHRKNSWTIDPNGSTVAPDPSQSDNHGTIDPNGLKNRSQIDPDGATAPPAPSQSDNRWTIDPDG